ATSASARHRRADGRRHRAAGLHRDQLRRRRRKDLDAGARVRMDPRQAAARHVDPPGGFARAEAAADLQDEQRQGTGDGRDPRLRRTRHPVPGGLVPVLRAVLREPADVPGRVRRLPADLRVDRRSRALHAVGRPSRAGVPYPEGETPLSAILIRRIAWSAALALSIELAFREIARRSVLHAVIGGSASVASLVAATILFAAIAIAAVKGRRAAGPLLTACFAVGIALQLQLGARLQSDGFYYFAYLRSLAFDRDVNFMDDYRMLGLGDKTYLFQPTRTGHAESAWTIGPAIVWSPFFAAGHVVALRLRASGVDVATDGTSYPYRQAVCVASLFYGLLGCWFSYRFARAFRPAPLVTPAVILTVAGSFMLWYLVKEPSMTHAASMASVAGVLWMWAATLESRTPRGWALLGLLIGLSALIRWQNLLFALLPGIDALRLFVQAWRAGDRVLLRRTAIGSGVFLACAFLAFLPQMLAWRAIYGTLIARSPVGPQIRWTDPHLVDILWSSRNGLFSTSPILYLGAI